MWFGHGAFASRYSENWRAGGGEGTWSDTVLTQSGVRWFGFIYAHPDGCQRVNLCAAGTGAHRGRGNAAFQAIDCGDWWNRAFIGVGIVRRGWGQPSASAQSDHPQGHGLPCRPIHHHRPIPQRYRPGQRRRQQSHPDRLGCPQRRRLHVLRYRAGQWQRRVQHTGRRAGGRQRHPDRQLHTRFGQFLHI